MLSCARAWRTIIWRVRVNGMMIWGRWDLDGRMGGVWSKGYIIGSEGRGWLGRLLGAIRVKLGEDGDCWVCGAILGCKGLG